jgi:hypothetical protein
LAQKGRCRALPAVIGVQVGNEDIDPLAIDI